MMTRRRPLLRILIDESDWWRDSLLYEAILAKAEEMDLESSSLVYGIMGFGWNRRIRRRRYWADLFGLTQRSPVAIEIADAGGRLANFLPFVREAVTEGLITLEGLVPFRGQEEWLQAEDRFYGEDLPSLARFGNPAARLRVHFHPSTGPEYSSRYAALVRKAMEMELIGATVFPEVGPDDDTPLASLPAFVHSKDCRLIAEFVDDPAAIERFAGVVRSIAPDATLETTDVRASRRCWRPVGKAKG